MVRRISQAKNKTSGLPRRLRLLAMTGGAGVCGAALRLPHSAFRICAFPTRLSAPLTTAWNPCAGRMSPASCRCLRRQIRARIPQPPSLRGGVADAAIQFHSLTNGSSHQPGEKQDLWIAASATPPRN